MHDRGGEIFASRDFRLYCSANIPEEKRRLEESLFLSSMIYVTNKTSLTLRFVHDYWNAVVSRDTWSESELFTSLRRPYNGRGTTREKNCALLKIIEKSH